MDEKIGVMFMSSSTEDVREPNYKEMFENPQSYNFISFPNIWDNKTPLGLFKAFKNDKEEDN